MGFFFYTEQILNYQVYLCIWMIFIIYLKDWAQLKFADRAKQETSTKILKSYTINNQKSH